MRKGANPYTNTVNDDVYDIDGKPTKVFSNGYQPNNYNGKPLSKAYEDEFIPDWRTDGKAQSIWTTDGGKTLYAWKGTENRYVRVKLSDDGKDWEEI